MKKKNIKQLKKQLEKEKKEIEKELEGHSKVPDFGSDVDQDQETDESGDFGNQLSIYQTFKNWLADVESALRKIGKGKYGICEKCGKEISPDLLKINPESRLCKECKKLA